MKVKEIDSDYRAASEENRQEGCILKRRNRTLAILLLMGLLSGCGNQSAGVEEIQNFAGEDARKTAAASAETVTEDETAALTDEKIVSASQEDKQLETAENEAVQQEPTEQNKFSGAELTFDFQRTGTPASNQIAVWVEDLNGTPVKTIYAANFTTHGGYAFREDTLKNWVQVSGAADMEQSELDAVSGATPDTGKLEFFWDGTDQNGQMTAEGQYRMRLEGTLYWSSFVLAEGVIDTASPVGDIPVNITYSEEDETNREMIRNVEMRYSWQPEDSGSAKK